MKVVYMIAPEQHAQILDALGLPSLKTASMLMQRDAAIAMLKAMKPVSPCAVVAKDGFAQISVGWQKLAEHNDYLYTPTKD